MKRWIVLICALVYALGLNSLAEDRVASGGFVQFGTETRTEAYAAEKYAEAEARLAEGDYAGAIAAFTQAQDYGDAPLRVQAAQYDYAEALLAEGSYAEASEAFAAAGDYRDAASRIGEPYYAQAEALLAAGDYEGAHDAFVSAGSYGDAAGRVNEPYYAQGEALLAAADYEGAIEAFRKAGNYSDASQRIPEIHYAAGEACLAAGEIAKAAIHFGSANHYEDSWQRSMELWNQVAERKTFFRDSWLFYALKSDGSTFLPGEFPVIGVNDFKPSNKSIDASAFENAIALSGSDFNIAGLMADGTVVVDGDNSFGQCEVAEWKDIVSIASSFYFTLGIRNDGTIVVTEPDSATASVALQQLHSYELDLEPIIRSLSQWSDIVEVAVFSDIFHPHVVGLKADGTVVAAGDNSDGECDVSDWTDIVAISTTYNATIGLKSDGTAVVAGNPSSDMRQEILEWTDIVDIECSSIAAGLKSDGTVTLAGVDGFIEIQKSVYPDDGADYGADYVADYVAHCADMLSNLATWSNIVDIHAQNGIIVYGLRADGTIISNEVDAFAKDLDSRHFSGEPGYYTFSGARISGKAAQRIKDMAEAQQAERIEAHAAEWEQLQAREFPTLQKGDKGEEVRALQERLVALGYLKGAADGDFGNKTEAAVKDFQTANALEPTGIADTPTQRLAFFSGATAK